MPFGERRLFERKSCYRVIFIHDSRYSYSGQLRDLGLGGAFIEPPYEIDMQIGQEILLTIPFGLKKDQLKIKAKVARKQPAGVGVRFIKAAAEG